MTSVPYRQPLIRKFGAALLSAAMLAATLGTLVGCESESVVVTIASNTTAAAGAEAGAAEPAPVELVEGLFPVVRKTEIGGKIQELKLTGTATRKKLGLTFYKIGGYCEASAKPTCADTLAAADVAKQLVLVMQRDISPTILERSFAASFADNDPENRFTKERELTLGHMSAAPMKKGQIVTITHVPGKGMTCQVGDGAVLEVDNPAFAHMVWNVYMGPKGVCPTLRSGLVTRLASAE